MSWAAAINVGGQLLGGLFGRRSAKKEAKRQAALERTQFVRLREAAELGGFNPLTVLRSTGGQGFQQTSGALASGSFIANALGNIGGILGDALDPMTRKREQLELDLLSSQVKIAQGEVGRMAQPSFNAPLARVSPSESAGRGNTFVASSPNVAASSPALAWDIPEAQTNTVTSPVRGWERRPGATDAENFEAAYGEGPSFFAGWAEWVADAGHNWRERNWRIQREWRDRPPLVRIPQFVRDDPWGVRGGAPRPAALSRLPEPHQPRPYGTW